MSVCQFEFSGGTAARMFLSANVPALTALPVSVICQFERQGYFCLDSVDARPAALVCGKKFEPPFASHGRQGVGPVRPHSTGDAQAIGSREPCCDAHPALIPLVLPRPGTAVPRPPGCGHHRGATGQAGRGGRRGHRLGRASPLPGRVRASARASQSEERKDRGRRGAVPLQQHSRLQRYGGSGGPSSPVIPSSPRERQPARLGHTTSLQPVEVYTAHRCLAATVTTIPPDKVLTGSLWRVNEPANESPV